jgi:hypothetical protein
MQKETFVQSVIQILNEGERGGGALYALEQELRSCGCSQPLTNIVKAKIRLGRCLHDRERYAEVIYEDVECSLSRQ